MIDGEALKRFVRMVEVSPTGCWMWTGHPRSGQRGSYGGFRYKGRTHSAHRWLYEQLNGPIEPLPNGAPRPLDHFKCSTPACVNPSHVRPVTHRENLLRGKTLQATNAAKTHCPQGHEYTAENTYLWNHGRRRICKTCANAKRVVRKRLQRARMKVAA